MHSGHIQTEVRAKTIKEKRGGSGSTVHGRTEFSKLKRLGANIPSLQLPASIFCFVLFFLFSLQFVQGQNEEIALYRNTDVMQASFVQQGNVCHAM